MANVYNITPAILRQKKEAIEKAGLELLDLLQKTWPDWTCDSEHADSLLNTIKLKAENFVNVILCYQAILPTNNGSITGEVSNEAF